jgi:transcriptional regulator with XRE-family HTH domain
MTEFGKNLRHYREKVGLTQGELADKLGITQQSIAAYESGTRKAKYPRLIEISRILNCNPDDLDPVYKFSDVHYCPFPRGCPFDNDDMLRIFKYLSKPENRAEKYQILSKAIAALAESIGKGDGGE